MNTAIKAASFLLALAAVGAYVTALINMQSPSGETWSDIGNATMLTACFLSLWALHTKPISRMEMSN